MRYNTNLYSAQGCMRIGSEPCYVLHAANDSVAFKWDLQEASGGADWRLGSREFHAERTAVQKAHDPKCEVTVCFENRKAVDDWSRLVGW